VRNFGRVDKLQKIHPRNIAYYGRYVWQKNCAKKCFEIREMKHNDTKLRRWYHPKHTKAAWRILTLRLAAWHPVLKPRWEPNKSSGSWRVACIARKTADSSGSAGLVRLSSGFQNRVPCSQAKRQDSPRCFSVFRVISSSQLCVVVFHFAYFEAFFRAVFLSHVSPVIRNIPWVNFLKFVYSTKVSHWNGPIIIISDGIDNGFT
jgi:hypothetical protein